MKRFLYWAATLFLAAGLFIACEKPENPDNGPDDDPIELPTVLRGQGSFSKNLNKQMKYSVWLPAGYDENKTYPFLYLLHGYGDDSNSWMDKGGADKIAQSYQQANGVPMVIIMPDGLTSFYVGTWEKYFREELRPEVENKYHFNGKRAVAGLSMGGYGTLYNVLAHPSEYTYGYAMSPATQDLDQLAYAQTDPLNVPRITVESGTQDYTVSIESVRTFVSALQNAQIRVEFIERSGGHDWNFWPVCLKKALVKIGESFQ